MSNTYTATFKVKYGDRFIEACDDAVTNWLRENKKSRLIIDLPKDKFVVGFEIHGIFYTLPEYMHDEYYVLRSAKQGIGSTTFGCSWVFGQLGVENDASEHAPLEADYEAFSALPEEVRFSYLWWVDLESAGTGLMEALDNILSEHNLEELSVSDVELAKQLLSNTCDC